MSDGYIIQNMEVRKGLKFNEYISLGTLEDGRPEDVYLLIREEFWTEVFRYSEGIETFNKLAKKYANIDYAEEAYSMMVIKFHGEDKVSSAWKFFREMDNGEYLNDMHGEDLEMHDGIKFEKWWIGIREIDNIGELVVNLATTCANDMPPRIVSKKKRAMSR